MATDSAPSLGSYRTMDAAALIETRSYPEPHGRLSVPLYYYHGGFQLQGMLRHGPGGRVPAGGDVFAHIARSLAVGIGNVSYMDGHAKAGDWSAFFGRDFDLSLGANYPGIQANLSRQRPGAGGGEVRDVAAGLVSLVVLTRLPRRVPAAEPASYNGKGFFRA